MEHLRHFIPLLAQLESYDRSSFKSDVLAGVTVGVMLIPQGMAYALIAGLPPIYGLYAALVPIIVYAVLGTSRQLAVGPVAMVSLLVAAGVAPLAEGDEALYIGYALLLSLMVGVIQTGMGVFRLGFLANFLSHPVLAGFTSAAALIIGFSQLKHLLGVDIARSNYVHVILSDAFSRISELQPVTLIIGLLAVVALVGLPRWRPRFPTALFVVAVATVLVWLLDLDDAGVSIVGKVPGGLPSPSIPNLDLSAAESLVPAALTIALVGFMESIAVAKVYARKNHYAVNPDQELVGLGLANVAGSFFSAYPTTGGFSRTAVNDQAGGRTTISSLVTAALIGVTLLALTSWFHYLPKTVLAAIVMAAVFKLIDVAEARYLWKVDRRDFWLMMLTFAATLGLGIEEGILVGVVASLVVAVEQSYHPHSAVIGRLPKTRSYRNINRFPEAIRQEDQIIFRMDSSLYFANLEFFKDQINRFRRENPNLRSIVLDFYPVNRIDSSAIHGLVDIVTELSEDGVRLCLAGVKGPVRDRMKRGGLTDMIGKENFFMELHDAVESMSNRQETVPSTVTPDDDSG